MTSNLEIKVKHKFYNQFKIISLRLNRGHVTKKQFYQSLNKLGIELPEKDVAVLEAKFLNNFGFNYVEFLSTFQPTIVEGPKYLDLKNELKRLNTQKTIYESKPLSDVQSILVKIKDLVIKILW